MYGHLSINPDGFLLVALPMWNLCEQVVISEAGRLKRAILMTRMKSLPASEERNRLYIGISSAPPVVPADFILYAIDIGMTYFRLPAAELEKRNREIQSLVDAEFDAADVKAHAEFGGMVKCLKAIGYLRSGLELHLFVRRWCTTMRNALSDLGLGVLQQLKAEIQVIKGIATRTKDPANRTSLKNVAAHSLTSARSSEVQALQAAFQAVMARVKSGSVIAELDMAFAASSLPPPRRAAALRDALAMAAADKGLTGAAVAQKALERTTARLEADNALTLRISVQAIEAGQAVGEFTDTSREALKRVKAARLGCEQDTMQTSLRLDQRERQRQGENAQLHSAAPSLALSADGQAEGMASERETLQRLSLDQLLRWIEGPVTGPRRRHLARGAALAKARTRRAVSAQQVDNPPLGQVAPHRDEPADSEALAQDIAAVAAQGYAAAAAFLRDDICDMLPIAEQLKLAKDAIAPATTVADSMDRLCAALALASDGFYEEVTQLELSRADVALTALREQLAQQR